jgi:hypothetical protein
MKRSVVFSLIFFSFLGICLLLACASSNNANPGGVGTTVVNSDSFINGEIKAIRQKSTGFQFEIDVLIQTTQDVNNLPNPVKDKVGQVVTVQTDENVAPFKAGQKITANIKYVGDVPKPGIILYMYDIKAAP